MAVRGVRTWRAYVILPRHEPYGHVGEHSAASQLYVVAHTGVDRIEDQHIYDAVRPLDASAALVQREYESCSKERVGEGS